MKGKTSEWIKGCKDGWFNWNKCGTNYPHGSKEFYEGYKAGWMIKWREDCLL